MLYRGIRKQVVKRIGRVVYVYEYVGNKLKLVEVTC